jgi:transposase-like protein
MAFKKALIERALGAELSHHLGYAPGATKPEDAGNHRNGISAKTVLTEDGPLRIEVPRDREGSFEPLLIPKHERRFTVSARRTRLDEFSGVVCASPGRQGR